MKVESRVADDAIHVRAGGVMAEALGKALVQRAHGVHIRWLFDCGHRGVYKLEDCHTQSMAAV